MSYLSPQLQQIVLQWPRMLQHLQDHNNPHQVNNTLLANTLSPTTSLDLAVHNSSQQAHNSVVWEVRTARSTYGTLAERFGGLDLWCTNHLLNFTHSDIALNTSARHTQSHSLVSTSDHTISGLVAGQVLKANSDTTFGFSALVQADTDDLKISSSPTFAGLSVTSFSVLEGGATPTKHTTFVGGDQTDDVSYTLPIASSAGYLKNTAGVLTWEAAAGGSGSGITWNNVISNSQAADINNGYIINSAGLCTITLPLTAALGATIDITGNSASGWQLAQNASQTITVGNTTSTPGITGYISSTNQFDAVSLLCTVADTVWVVKSLIGNINVN